MKRELSDREAEYLTTLMKLHAEEKKRKAIIRLILGLFLGVIVVASIAFLLLFSIPERNRDVVIVLVSGLSGAFFGSVISYYFGDSDSRLETPEAPTQHEKEEE